MKWIRLWPDYIINGTTFAELDAMERGVWFSLLAMAGYSPKPGTICITDGVAYTEDQLCAVLKLPLATMTSAIKKLIACEKITKNEDGTYTVFNWAKYQSEYERQKPYRRGLQGRVTKKGYNKKLQTDTETDTEEEVEKPILSPSERESAKRPPCPHKEILKLYHEICKDLPPVLEYNKAREGYVRQRWKAHPDIEYWKTFWGNVAASDFLCGKVEPQEGKEPFLADFEWCVRPRNFAKIIEGRYKNRGGKIREGPDPNDPIWIKQKSQNKGVIQANGNT